MIQWNVINCLNSHSQTLTFGQVKHTNFKVYILHPFDYGRIRNSHGRIIQSFLYVFIRILGEDLFLALYGRITVYMYTDYPRAD